jgi:nucleoside phosphorylase
MRSQNKLRREDYTVGWVCALPIELAAAKAMLDEKHDDFTFETRTKDENIYCMGSVAGHNVVIVCLPAGHIGTNPAAHVATQLQAAFKGLRFGLMVGIGGGVPSAEADIRLGDVVVSQPQQTFGGVVQYDFGKATPSGFQRTSMLSFPPQILLSAVNTVRANLFLGQSGLRQHVARLESFDNFQRRKAGADVLFEPAYDHPNGHSTCSKCDVNEQRSRDPREAEAEICVHYGTIASGNRVIKNASERDKVSEELGGVYCFEMEAAGLMNSFPCLVIRGICDYADSHKNKAWQPYAAGTAAAYAKELLSAIPAADVEQTCRAEEFMRADESQCSGLSVSSKRIRANNSAEDNMQCESQARGGKNLSHQQNQRLAAQTQIGAGKPRAAPNSRLPNQLPPTMPNRNLYMATDGSRESRADMALKRSQNRSILDSMRAETNHYRAQVVELQAALGREKEIVERTMQSANKMQSTMDNRELFLGEQANDDVVMAMFGKLMSDIKTWSTRFNAGDADAFSEERLQDYRRVAPQYTEVSQLGNISARKRQKRLFVRGWTAYVMCTKLFRSLNLAPLGGLGEDVWIRKELSESFSCLENELWLIGKPSLSSSL